MATLKLKNIKPKREMFYDKQKLSELNPKYNRLFTIRDFDTDKVNKIIVLLMNNIILQTPSIGDKVILEGYVNKKDIVYNNGHIESLNWADTGKLNVCTSPDIPHIRETGNTSTGGGYWVNIEPNKLSFVGYDSKTFWTWGFEGQKGDAALYFKAPVKVWKYEDVTKVSNKLITH